MKNKLRQQKRWLCILMTAVLVFNLFSPMKQAAAAGIRIYNYNTKTTTTYTGQKVKYLYNGRTIRMAMPGIIIDNIALAAYDDLFEKGFGLTCTYNKENGKITVSEGDRTITMTLGSKQATVNGKSTTLSVAPVKIKFVDEGIEKIYVPTRFVSENLGYSYVWTKQNSTAKITKTLHLTVNRDDFDYNGSLYRISYLNEQIDLAQMPAFSYHGVLLARAKKVFETAGCTYIQTEDGIILSKGDITLNMSFQDKCAYVNGKKFIMEEALYLVNNKDTNVSYAFVPFEFTAKMLGFDLKYDDTEKSFELLASERTGDSSKIKELVNYHSINVPGETPEDKIPVPGETTYFSWESLPAFEAVLENSSVPVHTIADGSFSELPGSIYVYMNKKSEADGSETFMFASSDKITSVESKFTSEGTLQVIVHNATSADYGSMVVGFPLVESYKVYELPESKQVILEFSLSKDKCQYTLSLSEDKQKLSVMVYPDYLTKAEAYPAETSDILLLHGVAREDIQVVEDNGMLVFSIPTAFNSLGDKFFFNQNTSFLNYCLLNAVSDGTRITVMMKPDMNYYFSEHGNSVAIHFTDMETEEDVTYPSSSEQKPSLPDDKLLIPLPEGITKKDIKDKDNYLNTNFVISIPGNQVAFYQNHPLSNPYSVIEDYSVSYNSTTGYTNISFDTKLICGYKYDVSEGHLIVHVARPNEIYSKVVVLDAGHGGIDPGAIKNKTYEKTLNYTILNKYTKEYFDKSDIKVYFTRLTDVKIDLYKRADLAAEVGADLFISLHMNANNSSTVKGTQVFYSSDNNKKNSAGLNSYRLAKTLAANLSTSMATKNRGASTSNFVVVKYNTVPAVLVELGFMTNSSDFKKLTDTSYQKKAAETIYKTVVQIFKEYPTGR